MWSRNEAECRDCSCPDTRGEAVMKGGQGGLWGYLLRDSSINTGLLIRGNLQREFTYSLASFATF